MSTHHVDLPEHLADFVKERIASGRYQDASEVVRAGLLLLEQEEATEAVRLGVLQDIARDSFEALDRGEGVEHTPETLDRLMDEIEARTKGRRSAS